MLGDVTTRHQVAREGVAVRTFRPGALALTLAAFPLAIGWSTGTYGQPPVGVTGFQLGAHWIASWLIPVTSACVLALGTAQVGVDRRLTAAGPADPRSRWWRDRAGLIMNFAVVTVLATFSQSTTASEPYPSLLVPALGGLVVAVAASHIVVARFDLGPGLAAGAAGCVTTAVTVLPYLTGGPPLLVIDPTLAEWMRDVPGRSHPISAGLLVWTALAAVAVTAARLLPQDVSRLHWITKEAEDRD